MCLNRSTLVKKISQIWKTKFPYNFFRSNRNPTKCTELFFYVGEETSFSISVILAKIKKHSTACRKQRKTIFNRTERSLILERNKNTISGNFYLQLNNKNKLSFKSILQCNSQKKLLHKTVRISSRESSWQNRFIKSIRR